jgi:hypothetical protein
LKRPECYIPTSALLYYDETGFVYSIASAGIIAPITEESIKAVAVLLIFVLFYREFDSYLDGIIYGSLAGFGFAAIENILYFASNGYEDPSGLGCLILMRAFLFGLNHAFFTSLTGMGFAAARYQRNIFLKILFPLIGLTAAIVAHGLHNSLVSLGALGDAAAVFGLLAAIGADWMGALGVLIVALVSLHHEAGWIKKYLADEIELGTLSAQQAANTSSFGGRILLNFTSLGGGLGKWWDTRHFYQQASELAYKKHQLAKMGNEGGTQSLIEKIRTEVQRLSTRV